MMSVYEWMIIEDQLKELNRYLSELLFVFGFAFLSVKIENLPQI